MRRTLTVLLLAALPLTATACSKSSRDSARTEFVEQMVTEGGLDPLVAQCVADRFFDARTDEELKEFFAREALTEDESAEFQELGQACLAEVAPGTT